MCSAAGSSSDPRATVRVAHAAHPGAYQVVQASLFPWFQRGSVPVRHEVAQKDYIVFLEYYGPFSTREALHQPYKCLLAIGQVSFAVDG